MTEMNFTEEAREIYHRLITLHAPRWPRVKEIADALAAAYERGRNEKNASAQQHANPFQHRVHPWLMVCFGAEISADRLERSDRFIEEALELLQSGDYPKERIYSLIEYVYGREKGDPAQEVGGVMMTLAAFCLAHGLDMHEAGESELARVWTKVDKIRAKQAAKPHGSALPIAAQPTTQN